MSKLQLFMLFVLSSASRVSLAAPSSQPWLDLPIGQQQEIVLAAGEGLEVMTSLGLLEIQAGANNLRTYTWDDGQCQRSAELWPRSSRWNGSYGLYFPGPGNHWQDCHGIRRATLEEGQMHFATTANALLWLQDEQTRCTPSALMSCDHIHTADGLVLQFGKIPSRKQLNVRLFQILINGEKPKDLPGAKSLAGHP